VKQLVNDDKRAHPIHLTPAYASNVAKALIYYVGKLESKTDVKLRETSEIALEAFYLLLNEGTQALPCLPSALDHDLLFPKLVPEVQDSVTSMSVTEFTTFHFDLHVLDGSTMEHRIISARLLQFLPKLSPKFEDMKVYVRRYNEVKEFLDELAPVVESPERKRRLSVEGHISPQSGAFYDVEVPAVCEAFGVDITSGLLDDEVTKRRVQYGLNELPKPKPRPWWARYSSYLLSLCAF